MTISQIALAGMNRVEANVERVAQRLARTDVSSNAVGAEDVVELSAEMMQLRSSEIQYAVLAKAMDTEKQINEKLIELFG